MKRHIILSTILLMLVMTSCVKDLDVVPKDPSVILSGNISNDPVYMQQVLAKIYASFNLAGQGGGQGEVDGPDISGGDMNFFTTMRALWNMQEITTDEAICAWGDVGIADLNTQTWNITNPFVTTLYQRLSLSITYANDFISQANKSTIPNKAQYIAEARFLRALAYYWLMDLFGNPPFTTEADGVGKFYPEQRPRAFIYDYVVSELLAIEADLGAPGFSYPQADKGACWMLLARTYLNAEVFTGTADWENAKLYCDKVIESGVYELNPNYRHNFCADNDYARNKEMIFAWESDGVNTQGYVGVTFLIESSSDPIYLDAITYHGLTENVNWNGNRARKDFLNVMIDTLALYGNVQVPSTDTFFRQSPDKRVFLRQKLSNDLPAPNSVGDYGIGVYKFTAKNFDGTQADNYHTAFTSTDWPIFRFSDAYLMRAEALHNMGNDAAAVADINMVRERAYGNTNGNITAAEVTDDFILDERAREFYYEGQRRTDLVRFGKYTDGNYVWQWKGADKQGVSTPSYLNIYPIPGDELSANPNLVQNPGYN